MAHRQQAPAAAPAAAVPAAAPAAQIFARPAVMPEAYDGSDDWLEYHQYYENCALVNGWPDAQKAQFLAVRLRGSAQRFYGTLPAARRANWQHVCADMAQRFAPAANVRMFKTQFQTRRRQPGEDLAKVADDLRRLVVRAYPQMPDHDREELVRDQFVEALTPVLLRLRLQENPPATVQAALETALYLERIWSTSALSSDLATGLPGHIPPQSLLVVATDRESRRLPATPVAAVAGPQTSALASAISALNDRLDRLDASAWDTRSESDRPRPQSVICWNCGRQGHVQSQCHFSPPSADSAHHGIDRSD